MSAVMSTLSMISGGRRAHRKLANTSGRKSGQYSDAGDDRSRAGHDLKQHRSASLQTLETTPGGGVVHLESLEAKMASIEVSLGGARRHSAAAGSGAGGGAGSGHARELDALRTALKDKDTLVQSLKKQLSASLSAARLSGRAGSPAVGGAAADDGGGGVLSADERRALQERAAAVRADLDARRANIADLRRKLERTHVTENIDTRIQQAELQYQVGREELELLTLGEQARVLHALIQRADAASAQRDRATLYSAVREIGGAACLLGVEAREGAWSAGPGPGSGPGLYVEWAADHAHTKPGDRLVEVNGVSMLSNRNQEELQRALSLGPSPARVVVLRPHHLPHPHTPHTPHTPAPPACLTQNEAASLRSELGSLRAAADDAERAKEGLRADNTRLTHRISYLEEQVAELLDRHAQAYPMSSNESCLKSTVNKSKKNVTNISITSEPQSASPKSEVQVFQKGPDITAIVAKLPGLEAEANLPVMRPRSNASGASSRMGVSPRGSPAPNHRSHSSHSLEHRSARMRHSLSHHCIHAGSDYRAETDAALRLIERNQRHIEKQRINKRLGRCASDDHFRSDSDLDLRDSRSNVDINDNRHREIKKAADRIEESIKKTNWAERKTLSIIEQLKRSQRLRKMKKTESVQDAPEVREAQDVQLQSERHYMYHRIDGKVLENAHKSSRRTSKLHSRSAKSSELESECSDYPNGDVYCSSPRIDFGCDTPATKVGHYRKHDDRPDGEAKSRPTPPRKPLRLSLHKARSAHSLVNGSESETPASPQPGNPGNPASDLYKDTPCKKPVKRTHASDKWSREKVRESGKATPRPSRKLLNGFSACEAPAADDLYPDSAHSPFKANNSKWC